MFYIQMYLVFILDLVKTNILVLRSKLRGILSSKGFLTQRMHTRFEGPKINFVTI